MTGSWPRSPTGDAAHVWGHSWQVPAAEAPTSPVPRRVRTCPHLAVGSARHQLPAAPVEEETQERRGCGAKHTGLRVGVSSISEEDKH